MKTRLPTNAFDGVLRWMRRAQSGTDLKLASSCNANGPRGAASIDPGLLGLSMGARAISAEYEALSLISVG